MSRPIPNELDLAAPKGARFWVGVHPSDDPDDIINECPGHEYMTDDGNADADFCDGSCVTPWENP